jgi:murein L,D-transpeptidase YcbB/YkuD
MTLFEFRKSPRARLMACACAAVAALAAAPLAGCDQALHRGPASATAPLKSAETDLMLKTLAAAPTHGFAPTAFPVADIEADLRSGDDGRRRAAEQRLIQRTLAYARAQHGLGIPAGAFDPNWGMRPASYDAATDFATARVEGRLEQWLADLPPPAAGYKALQAAYLPYLKIWQAGGWPTIPEGKPLKVGSRDARVAALRQRLAMEDAALAGQDPAAPFDAALAQAVQRFQARVGYKPTGVVDSATLAALNVTAAARAAQIRANLERWRWAPREPSPTRIEVNAAAGLFDLYVDNQPALHMLAAAGKPGDETPILHSKIEQVVLNPTWNVPESIATEELYPKGQAYLAANNFVEEEGRLVQQPGADNALGVVKFLFDNKYGVYLHDTPAKSAFERPHRQVSHGCVRLQHAVDLAKTLLSQDAGWDPARIDQALADGKTQYVKLSRPVPVNIYYWTAFASPAGLSFRDDVYGWDAEVLRALDAPGYGAEPPKSAKKT